MTYAWQTKACTKIKSHGRLQKLKNKSACIYDRGRSLSRYTARDHYDYQKCRKIWT